MAEIDGRYTGKTQHSEQGLEMVVPMNHVRRRTDATKIVDDRDRCISKLIRDRSQHSAERDWLMSAPEQLYQRHHKCRVHCPPGSRAYCW